MSLADWLDEVPEPDWHLVFDGNDKFMSAVNVHVAVLAGQGQPSDLKVFRRRTVASLIQKSGILGSFVASKHEFELVERRIFDFPLDVEFFEWEKRVFILSVSALEALTDIREITNVQAKKALQSLKSIKNLTVRGLSEIELKLQDRPRLSKRLASASRNNTFDAIKLTMLSQLIDDYGLPITATQTGAKLEISFDTENRVHVEEFVNMVADVYLRSAVTDFDYKAHSKQRVTAKRKAK